MNPVPPLIGSYYTPRVLIGQRVFCDYRRKMCRVSSWTDAPIPWPRVQPLGQHGGHGLLVWPRLILAIRTESAAALKYHFGVSDKVVWRWRQRFIPSRKGKLHTPGSKAAQKGASRAGAAAIKAKEWTPEELARRAEVSKGRKPVRWTAENGGWTPAEVKLLRGKLSNAEIAAKTGRSEHAVRAKRRRLEG